jgi:predicted transcriptional regulator
MSTREEAKKRSELLKRLRTEHKDTVERTQKLLKEQKKIHQAICQAVREKSKTVPEIAEIVEMPTHEVLWHVTALKKYDILVEDGMCGEYFLYKRVEEK